MAVTAGALSIVSVGSSSNSLLSAAATAGTAPYTYQWYRSTTSGFTPGGGNIIAGATSLSLNDSGLVPGTIYYYKVVATDSTSATSTSAQLVVTMGVFLPNPNQLAEQPILGQVDLRFNSNTLSVQFDPSGSGSLQAGQAVKCTTTAGGIPKVVPSLLESDVVWGFVNYDIKSQVFNPGDNLQISLASNVMYLQAVVAINRGQSLLSIPQAVAGGAIGGVTPVTGSSGNPIIGYALDSVAQGALVRVMLATPAPPYAVD